VRTFFLATSALLLLLLFAASGCATIINGTDSDVQIASRPEQATFKVVSVGGGITSTTGVEVASGTTPAKVNLSNKSEYIVKVQLAGYHEAQVNIRHSFNAWVICSALCGIVPAGIDVLTGGMWNMKPDDVVIVLKPAEAAPPPVAPPSTPNAPPPDGVEHHVDAIDANSESTMYVAVYRRNSDGLLLQQTVPLIPIRR
jgi:hypothetical protein